MNKLIVRISVVLSIILLFFITFVGIEHKLHIIRQEDEKECSEVVFDFFKAINNKNIDRIDEYLYGKVPVVGAFTYYHKNAVEKNLLNCHRNICSVSIHRVSFHRNMIQMSCLMTDENSSEKLDYIILEKIKKDWKIIEIYGDGWLTKELFNTPYEDNLYAYDSVFWDFTKFSECNYTADYQRIH